MHQTNEKANGHVLQHDCVRLGAQCATGSSSQWRAVSAILAAVATAATVPAAAVRPAAISMVIANAPEELSHRRNLYSLSRCINHKVAVNTAIQGIGERSPKYELFGRCLMHVLACLGTRHGCCSMLHTSGLSPLQRAAALHCLLLAQLCIRRLQSLHHGTEGSAADAAAVHL